MMTRRAWSADAERTYRRSRAIVRGAAWLVPRTQRAEWEAMWLGELWNRIADLDEADRLTAVRQRDLVRRAAASALHALWMRGSEWSAALLFADVRYAARVNRRRPLFSLIVVLTLALGIGATTAMFSIVDTLLIKPLPYPRASQLVYAYGWFSGGNRASISPLDFLDYQARTHTFASFAARTPFGTAVLSGGDAEPERVSATFISANFFSTLGVQPRLGRAFVPEETQGSHDVVVMSSAIWEQRYGSDPHIIGRTVTLDGHPQVVVGVMPAVLDRTLGDQLWRPFPFNIPETEVRRFHSLRGLGRLRDGVTLAQAQRDMDAIALDLARTYPDNASWHLRLEPYQKFVVGDVGRMLVLLLAAVGLVLLIACGNVALLTLARSTTRHTEVAVRFALGGSRGRVVRTLVTESVMLGLLAGSLGFAIAVVLVRATRLSAAGVLPRMAELGVDWRAAVFTAGVALSTGVLFGLAPALQATRGDVATTFRSAGKASGARGATRGRDALVICQVALTLLLLVGAGLLVRSFDHLQRVNPGFDASNVLTAQVILPSAGYESPAKVRDFWTQLSERARALPGATGSAVATMLPLENGNDTYFYPEGQPPRTPADRRTARINTVSDGYFSAMRIPLVAGRAFGAAEHAAGDPDQHRGSVIVNRQLAAELFPGRSAVGQRLIVDFGSPYTAEIVGVAGDVRSDGPDQDIPAMMYFSRQQVAGNFDGLIAQLAVRTRGAPETIVAALRRVVHELDPLVPIADVSTMDAKVSDSVAPAQFRTRLLSAFAATALALAMIGLYGVLAFAVTQRTREIGVRIAIGAPRRALFGSVVRRGLVLVACGVVAGLAAALAMSHLMAPLLFDVNPTDPLVFTVVPLLLISAGIAACSVPARRATRVDPLVALREE